jgi:hypothetical protein
MQDLAARMNRPALVRMLSLCAVLLAGVCMAEEAAPFAIEHGPSLQAPAADGVTVVWHTNRPGVASVRYGTEAPPAQTAVTSRDGLLPNDSVNHAVRLTGLEPGTTYTYQAATREFVRYITPYEVSYGDTAESAPFTFTTLDPKKESYAFLMWNDIHGDFRRLEAMFDEVSWEGVDFVVLNGDMISDFTSARQLFRGFYDACVARFAKTLPIVYARGNHEARGSMARRLADYLPGPDGRYYWSFDHGPAHFVVLDSGEDKADGDQEYAGLVDFQAYREAQAEWLRADLASDAAQRAKFRIVISHQPSAYNNVDGYGARELRRLWDPILNAANVHLWLSGHLHALRVRAPHEDGDNTYHAIVNPEDATTRVEVSHDALEVTVIEKGGKVLAETRIE